MAAPRIALLPDASGATGVDEDKPLGFGRLEELLAEPATTPQQWCERRPCLPVGDLVFGEPLGTLLVFALALLWIGVGVGFWRSRGEQRSRAWFGVALVLGGIGAALAGISYQALGYTLKCAGREQCLLTNGFEVAYSVTQALSVGAMLVAVAYACTQGASRRGLVGYAAVNVAAYVAVAIAGVRLPSRTLLSFEVLMLFALPGIALVILVAGLGFRARRDALDRSLLVASLLLVAVQAAYFAYAASGLTQRLWNAGTGFYFSENDVLHIGMIGWLVSVRARLAGSLADAERRGVG